ncbi:hypothetical protein EDE11_13641 [Methylomonas methanica]|uniref:DUF559 domain-containing protein n=1 Tax=Methylomonas methanica TaxID=421 RepID=A0ABY2CGB4_METMH|nr:hypothetical protein EDE11_13641 [Methylomonas methanica]
MSPTVFKEAGYRFFFFSREDPRKQLKEIESLVKKHFDELVG